MALRGNGNDFDVSFKIHASVATSTAQYKLVGMESSTTTEDFTVAITDAGAAIADTGTARAAVGIVQTFPSAGSTEVSVRLHGLSKARCAAAVTAGDFVSAYEGISTTAFSGHIVPFVASAYATSVSISITTVAVAQAVVIGRALEDGTTNTVISIYVNPQLQELLTTT